MGCAGSSSSRQDRRKPWIHVLNSIHPNSTELHVIEVWKESSSPVGVVHS